MFLDHQIRGKSNSDICVLSLNAVTSVSGSSICHMCRMLI